MTNAAQRRLAFFDDEMDALREAVRALGGPQVVGHMLRSGLAPDKAGGWLRDCLNAERREKLEFHEVLAIFRRAREAGCHEPWQWINGEVGYRCEPMIPEDEKADLMRKYIAAAHEFSHLAERIERLAMYESTRQGRG